MPGVEDYAYWNHTDPPEGMSRARGAATKPMDELIPDGVLSQSGMTIDVYHPLSDWDNRFWEVKPECIADYEGRVRHWAFSQAVKEVWHTEPSEERGFHTVFRTGRWIKTPESAKRWDEISQGIRTIIPPIGDKTWAQEALTLKNRAQESGSGMRWIEAGAQAIAMLRALHRSGQWHAFWQQDPWDQLVPLSRRIAA